MKPLLQILVILLLFTAAIFSIINLIFPFQGTETATGIGQMSRHHLKLRPCGQAANILFARRSAQNRNYLLQDALSQSPQLEKEFFFADNLECGI